MYFHPPTHSLARSLANAHGTHSVTQEAISLAHRDLSPSTVVRDLLEEDTLTVWLETRDT